MEWIRAIHEELLFEDARRKCEEIGGQLFDELDGTPTQLQFLYSKAGNKDFHLGIFRDQSNPSVWRKGIIRDKMISRFSVLKRKDFDKTNPIFSKKKTSETFSVVLKNSKNNPEYPILRRNLENPFDSFSKMA